MEEFSDLIKGRGAQNNPHNRFKQQALDTQASDGLDEAYHPRTETQLYRDHPKTILNKVTSPDIPMDYSLNPYQGCEHGCSYCYARNAHEYWGFSAGLDFETKIIVKENAPDLLKKELSHPKWKPSPVMFSGNTDCYQPIERQFELTRQCLNVFLAFRHPVGMITKNSLITRDIDILAQLAEQRLARVFISLTTLNEDLRRKMEPRTASGVKRLAAVRALSAAGIPTGVMLGPIIPGLNNHEIPELLGRAAEAGAVQASYNFVRLNGAVQQVFVHWIHQHYPDRADKVLHQISEGHGGTLTDHQFGRRMRGEGPMAEAIRGTFKMWKKKYFEGKSMPSYDLEAFRRPNDGQLSLF